MLDTAELGRKVSKEEFAEKAPPIRLDLLETQFELKKANFPVIVLFGGVDGAGKSETVNLLHEWLDPRCCWPGPTENRPRKPPNVRPSGGIGETCLRKAGSVSFLSAWYSDPILTRVYQGTSNTEFDESLDQILAFEKALADDGALIVKFWMHLGKQLEKQRLKQLEEDTLTRWRVKEQDWAKLGALRPIHRSSRTGHHAQTSRGRTPWHIVEGTDERYRTLSVTGTLLGRIKHHMELMNGKDDSSGISAGEGRSSETNGVEQLSYNPTPGIYDSQQSRHGPNPPEGRVCDTPGGAAGKTESTVVGSQGVRGFSTILVFEGWDAAGKGGAIRRIIPGLDARLSQVIPIMKPTDEEGSHHYLWRFWRHIPIAGRVTIFDRSWYGARPRGTGRGICLRRRVETGLRRDQ